MGITIKVTCDGCGEDLTRTGNSVDYRLVLKNEAIPSVGGFVTSMPATPSLEGPAYFCDLACLDLWRSRENYCAALCKDWWETWRKENSVTDGRFTSYPVPSDDLCAEIKERFKAKALLDFPLKRPSRG